MAAELQLNVQWSEIETIQHFWNKNEGWSLNKIKEFQTKKLKYYQRSLPLTNNPVHQATQMTNPCDQITGQKGISKETKEHINFNITSKIKNSYRKSLFSGHTVRTTLTMLHYFRLKCRLWYGHS